MRSALVLLSLAAAGCASTGTTSSSPTRLDRSSTTIESVGLTIETTTVLETVGTRIPTPAADLWATLPLVYGDLGIALATHDAAQMVIGNPGLIVQGNRLASTRVSRYLNCGVDPLGSPLADRYQVVLSVASRVRTAGEESLLETQVSGSAGQRGVAGNAVTCTSTGVLEEAIGNAAKLRLVRSAPS